MEEFRQRKLDLAIRLNGDEAEVDVYEPESGEVKQLTLPLGPGSDDAFDKGIGEEIRSWISLWADELHNDETGESEQTFNVVTGVRIKLTQQDIDDIMTSALEGGITYWCHKAEVVGDYLGEYASEQISRGGMLKLYDIENGDKYWLDRENFLKGFRLWIENGGDQYGAVQGSEVYCCNIDAGCADEIIQYALFGEVVYG